MNLCLKYVLNPTSLSEKFGEKQKMCHRPPRRMLISPPIHQDLQETRETFRKETASYHSWAAIISHSTYWHPVLPIYPNFGENSLAEKRRKTKTSNV